MAHLNSTHLCILTCEACEFILRSTCPWDIVLSTAKVCDPADDF